MDKKKVVLVSVLVGVFALSLAGVVLVANSNSEKNSSSINKTPYQLYIEAHPEYTKNEAEWLQDLINGNLVDPKTYVVTFNSNGGSTVPYQIIKEGEKATKPTNPTRKGYTFGDWTYNGAPWVFYGYSVTENITLHATWNIVNYKLSYDLNGGTIVEANPSSYTINSDFSLNNPTRAGYSFTGWFDENNKKVEEIKKGATGNINLQAHWSANENTLSISSNDTNKGTVQILSGHGYTDENISIQASALDTFAFRGWYNENNELISKNNPYNFVMPADSIQYHAEFDGLRELTLSVNDLNKGSVEGEGIKIIGDTVEVKCNVESGIFKGWFNDDDELLSSFQTYTFVMPDEDYHITAKFYDNSEEQDYFYNVSHGIVPKFSDDFTTLTYGMYPQSVVDDLELVNTLDELSLDEDPDVFGYYSYENNYYVKRNVQIYNFERYYSVTDYPKNYDNGEEMLSGSQKWFKVEPIVWDVLSENNGNYSLVSTKILERAIFDNHGGSRVIDTKTIYENNYAYSSVREWINNDFANKLFFLNTGDNYLVQETEVDNSAKTTGSEANIYACDNTVDKVFFPSVLDTQLIKEKCGTISALTTDYLRASGTFYNYQTMPYCGEYWTRSPDSDPSYNDHVKRVNEKGQIGRCSASLQHNVRPCITIKII